MNIDPIKFPMEMHVSNSMLSTWNTCKRMFMYKYMYRLESRVTKIYFLIGKWFGKGLDNFYEHGVTNVNAMLNGYYDELEKMSVYTDESQKEKFEKEAAVLEALLIFYEKFYKNDLKKYKYIEAEREFAFVVKPNQYETNRTFMYTGKIDLLLQYKKTKQPAIMEHKTTSKIDMGYIAKLGVDSQITGYILGANSEGYKVTEVIYNINGKSQLRLKKNEKTDGLRKRILDDYDANPEKYFHRQNIIRRPSFIKEFKADLSYKLDDLGYLIDSSDSINPKDDISLFYKNESQCKTNWGTCEFINLCSENMPDDYIDARFKQRSKLNPELDHEEED